MAQSNQILSVNPMHQELALYMIRNPSATLAQTGKHFNYSPAYISIIKNSDAFKAYYAKLFANRLEQCDPIIDKTNAMTELALEAINEKLTGIGETLSLGDLREIADMGLKRLGFGAVKTSAAPQVNINAAGGIVMVDRGDLAEARRKMAEVHGVGASAKQLAAPIEEATVVYSDSAGSEASAGAQRASEASEPQEGGS